MIDPNNVLHQVNIVKERLESRLNDGNAPTQGQLKLIRDQLEMIHLILDRRQAHRNDD